MTAAKRSKKGEGELQREGDQLESAPRVEVFTQGVDEGGPSKKVRATRKKKVLEGDKTASQLRGELNLEPMALETNPEMDEVNQGLDESEQPNEPPPRGDEVDYEESTSESDPKDSRRSETKVARLEDELKEMRSVMSQVLLQLAKSKSDSSGETNPASI